MAISHQVIFFIVPFTMMFSRDLMNSEFRNPLESAGLVALNLVSVQWEYMLTGLIGVILSVPWRERPWLVASLLLSLQLVITLFIGFARGLLSTLTLDAAVFYVFFFIVLIALTFGLNALWERHDAARAS